MWKDFKAFINKGNVVMIAVGLVMALYFQQIVNAVLDGVINPIIAAIFGKTSYEEIGFDIGEARISIGLVIDALISFLAVSFFLFLVVRLYDRYVAKPAPGEEPAPTDNDLLTEIRDILASRQN
jgi:large conductance mechanosensitive channel